jgi:hypothetical protein
MLLVDTANLHGEKTGLNPVGDTKSLNKMHQVSPKLGRHKRHKCLSRL